MLKPLKGIFPFIFILFLGIVSFRHLFFISYVQAHKSDFRQKLILENSNRLTEINISNCDLFKNRNGFEWKENNAELVIDGVYYEVIALKKIKDYTLVSVIEDKAENSLFNTFFSMNKGIHKDFSDLIKLLVNLTYLQSPSQVIFNKTVVVNKYNSSVIQFSDSQFYLKQIKPPQG